MLENNIQMAIQQQSIDLEDAIDVREIKNLKLANQVLKLRRSQKQEKDQKIAERNIQAQAQANSKTQQEAAQLEVQKENAKTQAVAQLEQVKAQLESKRMMQEVESKKALMELEFEMNMRLKSLEVESFKNREKEKEDRKDERTKIQASQQSEMIDQRKTGKPPKNFESAGNDIMGGGFDLGVFEPK